MPESPGAAQAAGGSPGPMPRRVSRPRAEVVGVRRADQHGGMKGKPESSGTEPRLRSV